MRARPATRVAAVATLILAAVYITGVTILNLAASARLTRQADDQLADRIATARRYPGVVGQQPSAVQGHGIGDDDDDDNDAAPVFLWALTKGGAVTGHSAGAPALAADVLLRVRNSPATGFTITASMASSALGAFRLELAQAGGGWLLAGRSNAANEHTEHLLLDSEIVAGPLVLLAMFTGSLIVGLRALAPVEQSRRRQLEFTADASHELRTPLSVISAETDLALSGKRTALAYRDSLARIQSENRRLKRLVDDLLWLARFDSRPPAPRDEPVDLATLAQGCAERFRGVGHSASVTITAEAPADPVLINAPPEWIDRLAGVLMDNACRYAGAGGQVRISARSGGSRASLTVEDSGPGIPEASRLRLFDRFHRADGQGPGTGLGLAIGDSIVQSTGGRWRVGDSPLGGALLEVSWRLGRTRHRMLRR